MTDAKNLGWANGWVTPPPELAESREAGHKIVCDYSERGMTIVNCPDGGWFYKIDSGD
jgi:hypothetical protein